ncbi:MAG: hypothetical protein HC887_04665 [Desulfobacteraceae bacterium]|nr:hypothetical protein [Desulfobacteraceae bacterium]
MRIAIIGAGAMGSLFGGLLSTAAEVTLIRRSEDHIRAVSEKGLVIEKNDGSFQTYHPSVTAAPESIGHKFDLALIFTKSYDTESAAKIAQKLLHNSGVALTLQNGMGNLEIIEEIVGKDRAVAGVYVSRCNDTGSGSGAPCGSRRNHDSGYSSEAGSVERDCQSI